ncbi:YegP family protein [Cellulomonas massiliensis]|uniref:YegP family protein n=1 Tax=Cellulomonas massiliensis TaxID=1465811 RepID=UPI00031E4464|nr:YegP family protein [Cellulomonas massiliensis]
MRFEIVKSESSGQFFFRIRATNGNVLANSEQYADKRSAVAACESIRKNAGDAEIVEL